MRKIINTYKHNIVYYIVLFLISVPPAMIFYYFDIKNNPTSDYFNYERITTDKEVYELGEDIMVTSVIKREKPLYMVYNDVLRCQFPGEDYSWYSSYVSKGKINSSGRIVSEWRYQ